MQQGNRDSKFDPPSSWAHCPGKDNPADLITRGLLADNLVENQLWFKGPHWLSQHIDFNNSSELPQCNLEKKSHVTSCLAVTYTNIDLGRWSSFTKTQRIFAWMLRFINNCKPGIKSNGPLTSSELDIANNKLLICAQRNAFPNEIEALTNNKAISKGSPLAKLKPFLDDTGFLRIKGRIENANVTYECKHPIIIPHGQIAKTLIKMYHQLLHHAGVSTLITHIRMKYFVFKVRKLAKSVCHECVQCKRHDSRPCTQTPANLPKFRVTTAPPFSASGLDFAGPLYCSDFPNKKFYILLFTCAVTRAVHLEVTDSLSLSDCVLAIKRFVARRGMPTSFHSDNAKTFQGVQNNLQTIFGHLAPKWNFIAPRAPWWGGFWERMVRSVKNSLRKSLGTKCLSRVELETTLHEIESCINSRPLTYASGDPEQTNPLTPAHFLIGRPHLSQIPIQGKVTTVTGDELREKEMERMAVLDKFWSLWSKDYILNLPPIDKGYSSNCKLKEGSVVLIREDDTPRLYWPMGIITKLFKGNDKIIRSVEIKTKSGLFTRPIQKVHNLEIMYDVPSDVNSEATANDITPDVMGAENDNFPLNELQRDRYVTKTGRIVKPKIITDV